MNILEIFYTYAKLSQVAYIDLSQVLNPKDPQSIVDAAISAEQERVPEILANNIFGIGSNNIDPWTMLSPYYKTSPDTGHSDPSSGFAAMLLTNPTYGKVLAIAGTEPTAGVSQFLDDLLFSDRRWPGHGASASSASTSPIRRRATGAGLGRALRLG